MLAAYGLTALIDQPERLLYPGSDMHRGGTPSLDHVEWTKRSWDTVQVLPLPK